jgi:glycosyltransferase involved in cell wall biosynthesis
MFNKTMLLRAYRMYQSQGIVMFSKLLLRFLKNEANTIREQVSESVHPYRDLSSSKIESTSSSVGKSTTAFTIVSKNYMHYALGLRSTFLKHNPECGFIIFLMDVIENEEELKVFRQLMEEGVKIISFNDLQHGISRKVDFLEMLTKYTILEMNTAIKPYAIEYIFNRGSSTVLYIDPDILFYSDISDLQEDLKESDILLTPHIREPYNDDKNPSETGILMGGTYNLGFIALNKTQNTYKMVRWWQDRLFDKGFSDITRGMFTDQKWVELVPSLFGNVKIFKHPGYNVAYWNLHERTLEFTDMWRACEQKLVFFHFSGLNLNDLEPISKHQDRFTLSHFPHLLGLFKDYRDVIRSFAPDRFKRFKYFFTSCAATHIRFPDLVRREHYVDIRKFIGNAFLGCSDVQTKLLQYLTEDQYGDNTVSRLAKTVWNKRIDLQDAFPKIDSDEKGRLQYRDWFGGSAKKEYGLDDVLVKTGYIEEKSYPASMGLNIIGYFENVIGVAEAARLYSRKMAPTGITTSLFSIESSAHDKLSETEISEFSTHYAQRPNFKNNLFFINANEINNVKTYFPHLFADKYNMAVWWWEFDDYFEYPENVDYIDEVIVFTDFVKTAIEKTAPEKVKVTKKTYPFLKNWELISTKDEIRGELGLSKSDYVFIYVFDLYSSIERKNPFDLLEVFAQVVKGNPDAKLVLKIGHGAAMSAEFAEIKQSIAGLDLQDSVIIIDKPLSRNYLMSLVDAADVYISLHRSEGLGLGMLEAMYLGKPVVATGYGGNLEFMNEENSYLVDYELTPISKDFGPYKKGWLWAQPDKAHAVSLLEGIISDKEKARQMGEEGQRSAFKQFNQNGFTGELYEMLLT